MKLTRPVLAALLLLGVVNDARGQALDPHALATALAAKPTGPAAEQLAAQIRAWFGGSEALQKGPGPKIDDLTVAWAVEAPGLAANAPAPRVVSDLVAFTMPLVKVGDSGLYAGVASLSDGYAMTWHYEIGDRRVGGGQLEVYETPADGREHPGVPKGAVKQMPAWESRIFAGTTRDWWVYVPVAVRGDAPAARDGLPGRRRRARTTCRRSSTT